MTAKALFPRQVAILGVGLLGGSIGLALRAASPNSRIVGYGHRKSSLETAREIGAIDAWHLDPPAAVADSDLVILGTPVGVFEPLIRQIAPALAARAIVTDVGSTKRSVVKFAEAHLPKSAQFIASHPIAGSEKRGVEYSRADLFNNRLCILTPSAQSDSIALKRVEKFWKMLGMRTLRMTPKEHDRLLGDISHLPHLVAAALVAMQDDAGLKICGKGFLDTTRIAGGDGGLWRDIFLDNADNLKSAIRRLKSQLEDVEKMLEITGFSELQAWLDAAAKRREKLLEKKIREINPD
jgi:prephenate dehydrogenase